MLSAHDRWQEEALCYSSTLYHTLKEEYYPWPNMGPTSIAGVYSPAVVIFKDDLDHDCEDLPADERRTVAVLTVAAPRFPPLSKDGETFRWEKDLDCFREKVRLVYRMAAHNGKDYVVLGQTSHRAPAASLTRFCRCHGLRRI